MTNTALQDKAADTESLPVRLKDPLAPTVPWTSKHDAQELQRILDSLHSWNPVDWDQVYDDLDVVLHGETEVSHHAAGPSGGVSLPTYGNAEELAERFCEALMQLVNRGLRDDAHKKHPDIAELFDQAHALLPEGLPDDPRQALGRLRQLGGVILELAERLEETGIVKGLVEC